MSNETRLLALFEEANPVPDEHTMDTDIEPAAYLATLQHRSSEMTRVDTKPTQEQRPRRSSLIGVAAVVLIIIGTAVFLLTRPGEEAPVVTDVVPTTAATPTTSGLPSTTVGESALADIPLWLRSGNGQWVPAQSAIPFAFTNEDDWNSVELALTEERFTICPPTPDGGFAMCNLASVAVLFLEPETVDETRDLLASFEGAELGEEQPVTIDGASGIRFEFTHNVPPLVGQGQGELSVPAAVVGTATERTPIGEGPLGRSIISIVDVDGVVVTLAFQGRDTSRGAPEDGFDTYQESGLAIVNSIIWGTP